MLRLSGDLPILDQSDRETACRNCARKFLLWSRGNRCHHCGFHYCNTCSDYWAALPSGGESFEAKRVCCFCVQYLKVTASSSSQLASDAFSHDFLLKYIQAYNIEVPSDTDPCPFIPKKDVIEAITALSKDGCVHLPMMNERYYRQHSIPNNAPDASSNSKLLSYPRPSGLVTWGRQNPWTPPHTRHTSSSIPQRLPFSLPSQGRISSLAERNFVPNSINQQLAELLVPSLDELLDTEPEGIESLDDDTLKAILESNQAGRLVSHRVLERKTLLRLVFLLVDGERKERERELELANILEDANRSGLSKSSGQPERQKREGKLGPNTLMPLSDEKLADHAESGVIHNMCVICQERQANIAVITCGHMVMCKSCSEAVLDNSAQCPFCRTPIPTKSHLIQIYTS